VKYPFSTVSITVLSKVLQKFSNSGKLSNLALCNNPLVHANMDAIELVDVSFPF